jgi:hypothetical protein
VGSVVASKVTSHFARSWRVLFRSRTLITLGIERRFGGCCASGLGICFGFCCFLQFFDCFFEVRKARRRIVAECISQCFEKFNCFDDFAAYLCLDLYSGRSFDVLVVELPVRTRRAIRLRW